MLGPPAILHLHGTPRRIDNLARRAKHGWDGSRRPTLCQTNGTVLLHERAAPAPKIAGIPREATLSVYGPAKQSKLLKVVPAGSGVPVGRFGGVLVDRQCR